MPRNSPRQRVQRAKSEILKIQRRISALDLLATGTLRQRTKLCGKPGCKCAEDKDARHGPYFEWSRVEKKALRHMMVSEEEAEDLAAAIENYRLLQELIKKWEACTLIVIQRGEQEPARRRQARNREKT